jgi:alkylation response protein AidB-like acyl-CoA dehydrogenase
MEQSRLRETTAAFVHEHVVPLEDAADGDITLAGGDELRLKLQAMARELGIFAPQAPTDCGGLGLSMLDRAPILEAAGHSLFGPLAINAAAPDEGNIHLLAALADDRQRHLYLQPLAGGAVRSAFAMTEPTPGAGADPTMLMTAARRVSGGWLVTGRKRFITGADGAAFYIAMARTSGEPGDKDGATMLLIPADTPGVELTRHVPTSDRGMLGGHCEIAFTEVFVPDDDVLGDVGAGFRHAQIRLGPARLTHVMRWLGATVRAHETALRYVAERRSFGGVLGDLGMVQQLIADSEIDLAATRALLREACAELDAGERASKSTSVAKTFAAEALYRVADRAAQMCGGLGVSADLPVARISRELRAFRIYDGPSEVHRWSLARRALREATGPIASPEAQR